MKKSTNTKIYEKDLFPIVKKYFEGLDYKVNAEVKDCDVVLTKDNIITVVELKINLNITAVYQALDRQKITDSVYIAIQKPKRYSTKELSKMKNLLKRLNIGFILIDIKNDTLQIILEPTIGKQKNNKLTKKIAKEIEGRTLDTNIGGTTQVKQMTAYKDFSIKLACFMEHYSIVNHSFLKKNFGIENSYHVMYNNFYGYYTKYGNGDFGLSHKGEEMLNSTEFNQLVDIYRKEILTTTLED